MIFKELLTTPAILILYLLSSGCATSTPPTAPKVAKYEHLRGTWKPVLMQTNKEVDSAIPMHYLVFTASRVMQRIQLTDTGPKILEKTVGLRKNGVLVAQMSVESEMYGPIARVTVEGDRMVVQGAIDEVLIYDRISPSTDIEALALKVEYLPVQKLEL